MDCSHHCAPVQCPNYKVCGRKFPAWMGSSGGGYCVDCFLLVHNTGVSPQMHIGPATEQCSICMETTKEEVKFPWCNHTFCCSCAGDILFYDETKFETSPVKFGCPPCPSGCINPSVGMQCNCPKYVPVVQVLVFAP